MLENSTTLVAGSVTKGFVYPGGNNVDWIAGDQLQVWMLVNADKIGSI